MQILLKRCKNIMVAAAVVGAIVLLLIAPAHYAKSVFEGVSLWAVAVLPATLPFFFLAEIFTTLGIFRRLARAASPLARRVFRVSGTGACVALLSVVSGYPVGARTLGELAKTGKAHPSENFRIACIATTSGPAFLVGAVGCGMYADPKIGWILWFSHLIGIFSVSALLFCRARPPQKSLPPVRRTDLSSALSGAVLSVLCVGGAIAIFFAFGQMVSDLLAPFSLPPIACGVIRGLIEMTAGCGALAKIGSPLAVALSAFLVTFGGSCVLMQQLIFLRQAKVKTLPFLGVKLLQGIVAGAAALGLMYLIA